MAQKSNVNGGAWLSLMTEAGDHFNERKAIKSDLLLLCDLLDTQPMMNGSFEIDSKMILPQLKQTI